MLPDKVTPVISWVKKKNYHSQFFVPSFKTYTTQGKKKTRENSTWESTSPSRARMVYLSRGPTTLRILGKLWNQKTIASCGNPTKESSYGNLVGNFPVLSLQCDNVFTMLGRKTYSCQLTCISFELEV